MDDMGFNVGDVVMLLNADEIEIAAGHNVNSSCTWHHKNVTECAGELAYVDAILEDTYYGGIGAHRHCIQVVTDDGSEICCHPEWLQLLKSYDEQDTSVLDEMFAAFTT